MTHNSEINGQEIYRSVKAELNHLKNYNAPGWGKNQMRSMFSFRNCFLLPVHFPEIKKDWD